MSVNRNSYTIVGYDLTALRDELFTEELVESKLYEELNCNQRKGKIQFFDDPMSGCYWYFGYIVSENDDYDDNTVMISLKDLQEQESYVEDKLNEILPQLVGKLPYQLIVFNEWT